jgi:hypothetical protein
MEGHPAPLSPEEARLFSVWDTLGGRPSIKEDFPVLTKFPIIVIWFVDL